MSVLNYSNPLLHIETNNKQFIESNEESMIQNHFFNKKPIFNHVKKANLNMIEEIDKERQENNLYYTKKEEKEKGNSFSNSIFDIDVKFINHIIESDEENEEVFNFPIFPKSFLNEKTNVKISIESHEKSLDYRKREKIKKKEKFPKFIVKKENNSTKLNVNKGKRGRKSKKKPNRFHYSYAPDNLLRKINVHYLTFIISFLNDILKIYNFKYKFLKLNYNFKKSINKTFFEDFKKQTIGDIIRNEISKKYNHKDTKYNDKIINIIKNNEDLNKILSDNYLNIFKNIYLKNNKRVNFKDYKIKKDIILSNNVKMFKDLLLKNVEKNNNNIKLFIQCIKKNFINDDINDIIFLNT